MAHGLPDWGLEGPKSTTYGLDDLGEHAVRVGSPVTYDRRGDVVWFTDFREGLGDVQLEPEAGFGAVLLATGVSLKGAYTLRCSVVGKAGGYCGIRKYLALPVASALGIEASFSIAEDTQGWSVGITVSDGAGVHYALLRYTLVGNVLDYWDTNGLWAPLGTVNAIQPRDEVCNTMKVVMNLDPVLHRYVRGIFNGTTFDMSTIEYQYIPGAVATLFRATIVWRNNVLGERAADLDCVIVTQNEP